MLKKTDIVISLALGSLGIYVLSEAATFPKAFIKGAPSAATFPDILAMALLVLCALLLVQSVRKVWKEGGDEVAPMNWLAHIKVWLSALVILTFLILFDRMDIFLIMPVMLMTVMLLMGERRLPVLIVVPLIFDVFIYAVFYKVFSVALPTVYF